MKTMKIMTIAGTRPEWIRLCRIINKLDMLSSIGINIIEHILIHTGQNYENKLSDIFFEELGIRKPDHYMNAKGSLGEQVGIIMRDTENLILKHNPDKVLILGDTNTGLASIMAERMGVPVYHMEAGNRCFDRDVPEEINRRIIDHACSYNLPYTIKSRENLITEGIPLYKIYVSGNPIKEVLKYYESQIDNSKILSNLKLFPNKYILCTFHRSECIDNPEKLNEILSGLNIIAEGYKMPIIVSVHPKTRDRLKNLNCTNSQRIMFSEPFGFFDFIKLEKNAYCMITDSGTCSEEACLLNIPNVIIRDTTERPETIEVGSSMLSGINSDMIFRCVQIMTEKSKTWKMPEGYDEDNVSDRIIAFLLGK